MNVLAFLNVGKTGGWAGYCKARCLISADFMPGPVIFVLNLNVMEHRQDYLESQMDIISKMLRRLLEKLLKLEPQEMESEMESIIPSAAATDSSVLTIDKLKAIEDSELIKILLEDYGYTIEHIKLLADILYALAGKLAGKNSYSNKALMLYRHYLAGSKKSVDFLVFSRVTELENKQA
jgi:hypothetical protein